MTILPVLAWPVVEKIASMVFLMRLRSACYQLSRWAVAAKRQINASVCRFFLFVVSLNSSSGSHQFGDPTGFSRVSPSVAQCVKQFVTVRPTPC